MKWVDMGFVVMIGALFVLAAYNAFFDMSPQQVAESYCHANGYDNAINYKFTTNTFFVNCTIQENCASNQECISKNGAIKQ